MVTVRLFDDSLKHLKGILGLKFSRLEFNMKLRLSGVGLIEI
jgi:hypothetical protein